MMTYVKEYAHSPSFNRFKLRGTQSGDHVNIMGNFDLIEDVLTVTRRGNGVDLGGDRVYSDIFEWSDSIELKL